MIYATNRLGSGCGLQTMDLHNEKFSPECESTKLLIGQTIDLGQDHPRVAFHVGIEYVLSMSQRET